MHRVQGISQRTVAKRMSVDVNVVRHEEGETVDLPLSRLYQWQQAHPRQPIAELLVEYEDSLSHPLLKRAQFVRG